MTFQGDKKADLQGSWNTSLGNLDLNLYWFVDWFSYESIVMNWPTYLILLVIILWVTVIALLKYENNGMLGKHSVTTNTL